MKIVQCQYCKYHNLKCEQMEFVELSEGRFTQDQIQAMIMALQQKERRTPVRQDEKGKTK